MAKKNFTIILKPVEYTVDCHVCKSKVSEAVELELEDATELHICPVCVKAIHEKFKGVNNEFRKG